MGAAAGAWRRPTPPERNRSPGQPWQAAAHQDDPDWALLRSYKRQLATLGPAAQLRLGTSAVTALELLAAFLAQLRHDLVTRSNLRLSPHEPLEAMIAVPANANSNQRFLTLEAFR